MGFVNLSLLGKRYLELDGDVKPALVLPDSLRKNEFCPVVLLPHGRTLVVPTAA